MWLVFLSPTSCFRSFLLLPKLCPKLSLPHCPSQCISPLVRHWGWEDIRLWGISRFGDWPLWPLCICTDISSRKEEGGPWDSEKKLPKSVKNRISQHFWGPLPKAYGSSKQFLGEQLRAGELLSGDSLARGAACRKFPVCSFESPSVPFQRCNCVWAIPASESGLARLSQHCDCRVSWVLYVG